MFLEEFHVNRREENIMASFTRLDVLNTIINTGLVPVFYNPDIDVAKNVAKACLAGGLKILEFTNRGDFAPEVFKELSLFCRKEAPGLILGVGSIIDEPTAALYIAYGANYVVSPILNEPVARLCNRRKIAYMPGCGSASEISFAEELGSEIIKIFPADSVGGPNFVKSILGPMPWTRIMPTGGVEATRENINAWIKAGAAAVGIGSNLIRKELLQAGDYNSISTAASQLLSWIQEARGMNVFTGIEHVGLYPYKDALAPDIANWYNKMFGFKVKEGQSSIFVESSGSGRIEVMKAGDTDRCHIAVMVSNFDIAVAALKAKGVEMEEPKIKADTKAVFLKQTDPAGNIVHLLWRA
jgi:2-dehydro-3-deoxyphosphogluconate aldolase / (4S)-4-hydroxy-2-oxoglutarate aldolase